MIDLILRLASGARAAIAVAAFGVGGTVLFRRSPYESVKALLGGDGLPEESITSPEGLAQVLADLGAAGRESYLRFQLWDLANPILMGIAGVMLLGWLLRRNRRSNSAWRFVVLLPVVLLVADILENVVISMAISAFPDRAVIGAALPFVTSVKFGAAVATLLAAASLALVWLRDGRSWRRPGGRS